MLEKETPILDQQTPDTSPPAMNRTRALLVLVVLAALTMVALRAEFTPDSAFALISRGDNDDILRFLSVKAFLQGQSWFDMTQYRILAPEGVALHWSRYIDLGIASLVSVATAFAPPQTAQAFAIVVWPLLLFVALVFLTAFAAHRLMGASVAIFAVLSLMTWPVFLQNYFQTTRLDHHNVQILLLTILIVTLMVPRPTFAAGVVGGVATAFSIAVGLEILLAIGLAGVVLALRTLRDPQDEGRQLLALLGAAATLGTILFFGQTPASEWSSQHCDELSPVFLYVLGAGLALSWGYLRLARRLERAVFRLVLLLAVAAIGGVIAVVILGDCIAGPYGALPPAVQDIIRDRIGEAGPVYTALAEGKTGSIAMVVPISAAIFFGLLACWVQRSRGQDFGRTAAVLLAFSILGLVGMFSQQRFVVIAAGAVPMLTGFALSALLSRIRDGRSIAPFYVAFALALATTVLFPYVQSAYLGISPKFLSATHVSADPEQEQWATDCRNREHLRALSRLPGGVVLAPDRIGSSLLLVSDHTILAAPYHRSVEAMRNIDVPFVLSEPDFRRFIDVSGTDYVVLCALLEKGDRDSFTRRLAMGVEQDGFNRIELPAGSPLVAYEVTR